MAGRQGMAAMLVLLSMRWSAGEGGAGSGAPSGLSFIQPVSRAPKQKWRGRATACFPPSLFVPAESSSSCGVPRTRQVAAVALQMANFDGRMQRRDVLAGAFALNVAGILVPGSVMGEESGTVGAANKPMAYNQLDAGTSYILSQDEELIGEEDLRDDMIFTFRGDQMVKTNSEGALRYLSRRNAVFFGESHDSFKDKKLATRILKELHERRGSVVVGLEMVRLLRGPEQGIGLPPLREDAVERPVGLELPRVPACLQVLPAAQVGDGGGG
eukprot:761961-Hanusia_phi.AAC.9